MRAALSPVDQSFFESISGLRVLLKESGYLASDDSRGDRSEVDPSDTPLFGRVVDNVFRKYSRRLAGSMAVPFHSLPSGSERLARSPSFWGLCHRSQAEGLASSSGDPRVSEVDIRY